MGLRAGCFSGFGLRGARRRRLLADELTNPEDWPTTDASADSDSAMAVAKPGHYGDAHFLKNQPQLFDLVPQSIWTVPLLLFILAAFVGCLELGYGWMLGRASHNESIISALDLAGRGSLGRWFSSLILLAATGMTMLVYTIRRHKTDDYQGRYRVWIWAALCWFIMASDQAAGLHEAFRDMMIGLTGTALSGNGDLWCILLAIFALGTIGSRLFVDMQGDYPAVVALAVAGCSLGFAGVAGLGGLSFQDVGRRVLVASGSEMIAYVLLLGAMVLHARYVLCDAQGRLPQPEPDEEEDAETARKSEAIQTAPEPPIKRYDPKQAMPQPPHQPIVSPQPTANSQAANHKLSKTERKALKERLLRERASREKK